MKDQEQFEFNSYDPKQVEKMNRTLFDVGLKQAISKSTANDFEQKPKSNSKSTSKPNQRRSKPKKRRKMSLKQKILASLIIILIFGSVFTYSLYQNTKNAVTENKIELQATAKTNFAKEPSNILIMGSDENSSGTPMSWRDSPAESRADTLILLRFDPIQKTIVTSSIPRDTLIENTCTKSNQTVKYKKINSTVNTVSGNTPEEKIQNGMECLAQEYKNNFNVPINYIVRINMRAVMTLVDQIGGLEFAPDPANFGESTGGIFYSQDEYDNKNSLKFVAGQMTKFNGSLALSYGRYRDDSDFFRGARQQEVAKQIIKKMATSPAAITSLPNIIRSLNKDIHYNFGGEIIDDLLILAKDLNQYQTKTMEKFDMIKVGVGEDYSLTDESQALFEAVYNGKTNLFAPTPTPSSTPKTTTTKKQ